MPKRNFRRTSAADFKDFFEIYQDNAHIPMVINPMAPHLPFKNLRKWHPKQGLKHKLSMKLAKIN